MAAGTEELVVVVAPLVPVLDAGVDGVEEVEVDALVCSAEVEVVHGVAAISEASPKIAGFQRKEEGIWERRTSGGGAEEEEEP